MEDKQLMAKYTVIEPKLRKYALTLTKHKENAEDLLQDTFINIWTKRHLYTEMAMFKAWCFTIMYNRFISSIPRNRPEIVNLMSTNIDDDTVDITDRDKSVNHPINYAFTSLALDEVELLLADLTDINRSIVKDRVAGFSFKEIGSKNNISGDSAKLRYHNSISKLKSKLDKNNPLI
jgi:RNA polymerase sigma factor (sigma-70 family)